MAPSLLVCIILFSILGMIVESAGCEGGAPLLPRGCPIRQQDVISLRGGVRMTKPLTPIIVR